MCDEAQEIAPGGASMAQHAGGDRNSLVDHHYGDHMQELRPGRKKIPRYTEGCGVSLDSIQPDWVDACLRFELNRYGRKHERDPHTMSDVLAATSEIRP